MFHMRKSQLDFRTLAETLAMDKDKLEDYVKVSLPPTAAQPSKRAETAGGATAPSKNECPCFPWFLSPWSQSILSVGNTSDKC